MGAEVRLLVTPDGECEMRSYAGFRGVTDAEALAAALPLVRNLLSSPELHAAIYNAIAEWSHMSRTEATEEVLSCVRAALEAAAKGDGT